MVRYEKALFLYNGNAGSDDLERKLTQTLPTLTTAIKELTIIQTRSINEVKKCCIEFASRVELIIILGGDGTVHECINSIAGIERRPVIAILPGGTCNDFSRTLQIPQNFKQASQAIVNGEVVSIDLGKTGNRYFLNFWGIGLVSETSLKIDESQKKAFGVLSYFMSTIKTVNQAEAFSYQINTGNETYDGEAVMIMALNGKFIGTRQLPIASIDPNDGLLDILIVKNSTLNLFRELMTMNLSNRDPDQLNELIYFQAKKLKVTTDVKKKIDMDGELNGTTPSEITVLPNHIRMVKGIPSN